MPFEESKLASVEKLWRASNYITLAMLYLKNNVLLEEPLKPEHFKPQILGHWGANTGINAIYAQVNDMIRRTGQPTNLVVGTGHASSAVIANLYLEGSLEKVYPQYTADKQGLQRLIADFATSEILDTEISAALPGMEYAGGSLGAALAFAQGYAFNNAKETSVCIVGDGELETSLTNGSWQGHKFLSSENDGNVIPVINANGFKMGSRSLFGLKTREEKEKFFESHGMRPLFAGTNHQELALALEQAYDDVSKQHVIILNTPKGWTAPEYFDEMPFANNHRAHKPVLRSPQTNPDEMKAIEKWLRSYKPEELFDNNGQAYAATTECIPEEESLKIGCIKKNINKVPARRNVRAPIGEGSFIEQLSIALLTEFERDKGILVLSPDELTSNKLGSLYQGTQLRNPVYNLEDNPPTSPDGQVIEVLAEDLCYAWAQGNVHSGQRSVIVSYEAFAPIFDNLAAQHLKFLDEANLLTWRPDVPSLNIVLTSVGWDNCSSHQNPSFVDTLLLKNSNLLKIYTPTTAASTRESFQAMLSSVNGINIMVVGKHPPDNMALSSNSDDPKWGAWQYHTQPQNDVRDKIILIGIGDVMTGESLAAQEIIHEEFPEIDVSTIGIDEITMLKYPESVAFKALSDELQTADVNIWTHLGYPQALQGILWGKDIGSNNKVLGYVDQGTVVSGLERLEANSASRFHIAFNAINSMRDVSEEYDPSVLQRKHATHLKGLTL